MELCLGYECLFDLFLNFFKMCIFSVNRGSLLDTGSSRGFSSDPWSADVESEDTRNKGVNELRQQQHQIIAGKVLTLRNPKSAKYTVFWPLNTLYSGRYLKYRCLSLILNEFSSFRARSRLGGIIWSHTTSEVNWSRDL